MNYDEYPSTIIDAAALDKLAVLAHLNQIPYAHPNNCRVLEVGCSIGGHLIPMAILHPGSFFVGLDINEKELNIAKERVQQLGLTNIELICADASSYQEKNTLLKYDYIICHGVVSWISEEIAQNIFQNLQHLMKENGICYLSHLCMPKDFIQQLIQDVFWMVHSEQKTLEEIRTQGLLVLHELLEKWKEAKLPAAFMLIERIKLLEQCPTSYVLQEYLCPRKTYTSYEIENLTGLSYIGESTQIQNNLQLKEDKQLFLDGLTQEERSLFIDIFHFRGFRSSVYSNSDTKPQYDEQRLLDCYALIESTFDEKAFPNTADFLNPKKGQQIKLRDIEHLMEQENLYTVFLAAQHKKRLELCVYEKDIKQISDRCLEFWMKAQDSGFPFKISWSTSKQVTLCKPYGSLLGVADTVYRWFYWTKKNPQQRKQKMLGEILLNKFDDYQNLSVLQAQHLVNKMEKEYHQMFTNLGFVL